ncbi:hypothetical protein COO60DRAFT_1703635 [Scenedesmus sp. NREL 46B-D3]|nr:hypothetical protein COO60DRAFT_1703627 [Scenedesmus sp. NREL 46B-D3]KAF6253869.1 hypothetical protein COO60DRAFT_1703635 [Scenedesmus sp. NREL 46B-D3]
MSGKRNRVVTTSRSGGQASSLAVLLLAAAGVGWFWWRRQRASPGGKKQQQGSKGGRSGFRFPGAASKAGGARIASSGKPAAAFTLPGTAAAGRAGGARKGNPKKTNKQQRKEEKAAKKAAKAQGLELIHNAQLQKKQEQDGMVTIKYVDTGKTSDIYDKVREYQETGKKRFP